MDGKGNVPIRARSLREADENILWESGQLGCNSSRSFMQTVWWNNCLHFGMRSRKEHLSLKIQHFHPEIDENGIRYISGGNWGSNLKLICIKVEFVLK